jgi:hypothetical protein
MCKIRKKHLNLELELKARGFGQFDFFKFKIDVQCPVLYAFNSPVLVFFQRNHKSELNKISFGLLTGKREDV